MRVSNRPKEILFSLILSLFFGVAVVWGASADGAAAAAGALPDSVNDWRAVGAAQIVNPQQTRGGKSSSPLLSALDLTHYGTRGVVSRAYRGPSGPISISLVQTSGDSHAYAMFSAYRLAAQKNGGGNSVAVGTEGVAFPKSLGFFKGASFAVIEGEGDLTAAGRTLAETLDAGENEIPPIVKHLPDWEQAQKRAAFVVSLPALQKELNSYAALFDEFDFTGGTEAIVASYGDNNSARLLIVEQTTPQHAVSNNALITERLNAFRQEGRATPAVFKREGNYLIFVFDQPDQQAAENLANQVKYEQWVRWLGDNPHAYEKAEKLYAQTTAGMILATLKATGVSLLICLGVGAVFGGFVFARRRSQQTMTAAYSDAGGMIRLNIDDITPAVDERVKLLNEGK